MPVHAALAALCFLVLSLTGAAATVAPPSVDFGAGCRDGSTTDSCVGEDDAEESSHIQLVPKPTLQPSPPAMSATAVSVDPAPQQPPAKYTTVACVGDSITFGYHAIDQAQAYPAQLQSLLGTSLGPQLLYQVANFGHSGAMVTKIPSNSEMYQELLNNGKTPYWDTEQFNASKAMYNPRCGSNAGPDIVIIQLGTNDANSLSWPTYNGLFEQSYLELIKVYQSLPSKPKVFISVPPPLFIDGVYSLIQEVINGEFPLKIPAISRKAGLSKPIPVHDVFKRHCPIITNETTNCDWISGAGFGTPPTPPFDDGCHPNSNGYYAIAATVLPFAFLTDEPIG